MNERNLDNKYIEQIMRATSLSTTMETVETVIKSLADEEMTHSTHRQIKDLLTESGYQTKSDDELQLKAKQIRVETRDSLGKLAKEIIHTVSTLIENDFEISHISAIKSGTYLVNKKDERICFGYNNAQNANKSLTPTIYILAGQNQNFDTTIRISDNENNNALDVVGDQSNGVIYCPNKNDVQIVVGNETPDREKFTALLNSLGKESASESLGR